jgi:hypothetical protein
MNGRLNLDYFSFGPRRAWARLGAALAVSSMVHAAVVLLPESGPGSVDPVPAPALALRLVPVDAAAAPDPVPVVQGATPQAKATKPVPPKEAPAAPPRVPGIGVLPIPAHHFHTAEQLTRRAKPLSRPNFDVPRLEQAFTTGSVVLKVWIDALGSVVAVEIEASDVPQALAMNAAKAFAELRYAPGEISGRRVATLMRIEVAYVDGKQAFKVIGAPR